MVVTLASVLNQIYMNVEQDCFAFRRWENIVVPLKLIEPICHKYLNQDIYMSFNGINEIDVSANCFINKEKAK